MRKYLLTLQKSGLEWLHAIIWCITPEDRVQLSLSSILPLSFFIHLVFPQKLQYLREQAAMIKLLEERFTSIWENVIILAKEGKEDTKQSFQVQGKH